VLEYEDVKRNKRQLLALTGLTIVEIKTLLPRFATEYSERFEGKVLPNGKPRKRAVGGGRSSSLKPIEQKLLFILIYVKTYPLQAVMGGLFGISQPRVNIWIHRLLPVLNAALDRLGVKPQRNGADVWISESGRGEGRDMLIDATERRRQRPKDSKKQAEHYSGKKKTHSDKNVLVTNKRTNRVVYLGQTFAGKVHDKKLAEQAAIRYPRKTILHKDSGFQGYEPQVAESHQPKKATRTRTIPK
jgi:hypothetical protein